MHHYVKPIWLLGAALIILAAFFFASNINEDGESLLFFFLAFLATVPWWLACLLISLPFRWMDTKEKSQDDYISESAHSAELKDAYLAGYEQGAADAKQGRSNPTGAATTAAVRGVEAGDAKRGY